MASVFRIDPLGVFNFYLTLIDTSDVIGTLFTPFVTTKANGIGIGLTIAQRIIEAHNGTITARQNANGGATFAVTLPHGASPGVGVGETDFLAVTRVNASIGQ